MTRRAKAIPWTMFPLKTCLTSHACALCSESIALGQRYFDGGINRRAHESCAPQWQTKTAYLKEHDRHA